jgi:hypothetical protein
MGKKCVLCNEEIKEDYGKLKGTMIRVVNEKKKRELIYVCSDCQKKDGWMEKAKIKGA